MAKCQSKKEKNNILLATICFDSVANEWSLTEQAVQTNLPHTSFTKTVNGADIYFCQRQFSSNKEKNVSQTMFQCLDRIRSFQIFEFNRPQAKRRTRFEHPKRAPLN